MLLGISMGWLGDSSKDDHVIWAYFYQSGNTEDSDWLFTDSSYTGSKFRENEEAKFKMENLDGHIKELYVLILSLNVCTSNWTQRLWFQ